MARKHKMFVSIAAISGALAVVLGAFGAHALSSVFTEEMSQTFSTASQYHFYHSLAMIASAWTYARWHNRAAVISGWAFLTGIVIFSGSLYLLAITGMDWLGAITPIGGVGFIVGWIALAFSTKRNR
ncbi:MAG: hypothetical protein MAGBODY4_00020 [Candidatus Marinimicrobia bacterium]|nr:hypothetical protein [Candidatus Neomarinimicrobiota bacterium]